MSDLPADAAIETVYVIEATYAPDAAETREPFRGEHATRLLALRDEGVVIEAGGFLDMSGSVILVRAASEEAALEVMRRDVYIRNGVWVELRCRSMGRVVRPAELEARTGG